MKKQRNLSPEEKLIKSARICKIISRILCLLDLVACLAFIALAIVTPFYINPVNPTKDELLVLLIWLALLSLFLIGILWNVKQIFVWIEKEQKIFSNKIAGHMKKTGIYIVLFSFIPSLIGRILMRNIAPTSVLSPSIQISGILIGIFVYLFVFFLQCNHEIKESKPSPDKKEKSVKDSDNK